MINMEAPKANELDVDTATLEDLVKQINSLAGLISIILVFQEKEQVVMNHLLKESGRQRWHIVIVSLGVAVSLIAMLSKVL